MMLHFHSAQYIKSIQYFFGGRLLDYSNLFFFFFLSLAFRKIFSVLGDILLPKFFPFIFFQVWFIKQIFKYTYQFGKENLRGYKTDQESRWALPVELLAHCWNGSLNILIGCGCLTLSTHVLIPPLHGLFHLCDSHISEWLVLTLGDVRGHTDPEQGSAACCVPNMSCVFYPTPAAGTFY